MPDYTIQLTRKASKQLDKLPDQVVSPILNTISKLASEPPPNGCKKLKGREAYRVRQGTIESFMKSLIKYY